MEEVLKDYSVEELCNLMYTWWTFYRVSPIAVEVDETFKGLIETYLKELIVCATCLHKDSMPSDHLVRAVACGYSDNFLSGMKISIGLFFSSEDEFLEELKVTIKEIEEIDKIKGSYSFVEPLEFGGEPIYS